MNKGRPIIYSIYAVSQAHGYTIIGHKNMEYFLTIYFLDRPVNLRLIYCFEVNLIILQPNCLSVIRLKVHVTFSYKLRRLQGIFNLRQFRSYNALLCYYSCKSEHTKIFPD